MEYHGIYNLEASGKKKGRKTGAKPHFLKQRESGKSNKIT